MVLDLFISYKTSVDLMYQGPGLDNSAKEYMLCCYGSSST